MQHEGKNAKRKGAPGTQSTSELGKKWESRLAEQTERTRSTIHRVGRREGRGRGEALAVAGEAVPEPQMKTMCKKTVFYLCARLAQMNEMQD